MIDLHEGVAELFAEAAESATDVDLSTLRFDTHLGQNLSHEARWILEARLAPGIVRTPCPQCGAEVELRPGNPRPLHMGPRPIVCGWRAGDSNATPR